MNTGRLLLVLGLAALGLGLASILVPDAIGLDLGTAVVTLVGLLAVVEALRAVQSRRRTDLDEATTPDPELSLSVPAPGEEFDSAVGAFIGDRQGYYRGTRAREGLRAAAVAVLREYQGLPETEAKTRIEEGIWTDDPYAAAFLGGEGAPEPARWDRIRDLARRESARDRRIRRTVDAIAGVAGMGGEGRSENGYSPPVDGDRPARFSTGTNREFEDWVIARGPHPTERWQGIGSLAFAGIGLGILVEQPAVLLAGAVGVGYAAYARSSAFSPGRVSADRVVEDPQPAPGDEVSVQVTVTNESGRFLPDLRLVDGVPEALSVAEGSPRLGTALRAGESATFSYSVTVRRGVHEFGPALLVARDLAGATEEERLLAAETTLTCVPPLRGTGEPLALRRQATRYAGRVETGRGGEGTQFHATREYRPGDPLRRIDWNRRARTGELTTVEFREERAATVVVLIDARKSAYRAPAPDESHAVDRSVDASGSLFATLSAAGDRIGIAALSNEPCWLAPGTGRDHRSAARELLATHPALSSVPPATPSGWFRSRRRLRRRLSPGTQVVFCTPLVDDSADRFARRLDEHGYPVTVLSPDPTGDRTPGHRLAAVSRTLRISALRRAGIPVIDWQAGEPLDAALARHGERGSG
ncbi:DUF58 domain-containing protein [Halalkalicoccus subterraneus]|uniref:DUF58 domain-containing protein n=1 Tax=Halalkalicoccus subterraneus TaxID=2675002 RepID=UPI000EFBDC1F|nr:DUF58 domain-containing protein [Halalkalicoccus subterraneus]